jgi:hypothetical protein
VYEKTVCIVDNVSLSSIDMMQVISQLPVFLTVQFSTYYFFIILITARFTKFVRNF